MGKRSRKATSGGCVRSVYSSSVSMSVYRSKKREERREPFPFPVHMWASISRSAAPREWFACRLKDPRHGRSDGYSTPRKFTRTTRRTTDWTRDLDRYKFHHKSSFIDHWFLRVCCNVILLKILKCNYNIISYIQRLTLQKIFAKDEKHIFCFFYIFTFY